MIDKPIKRKRTSIIVLSILLVLFIICCLILNPVLTDVQYRYPNSTGGFQNHGVYEISPDTIIASLDHGDTNVFMPALSTPDSPLNAVLWHQTDILKVVNALNQHVWHDTLADWKVYEVLLSTSCENHLKGFEGGRITFFKPVWGLSYIGRSITLTPQYDFVTWGGESYFPRPLLGWKNHDLRKFKVTADDAVQIADENGGKEFRTKYADRCGIMVYAIDKGWEVQYIIGNSYFNIDIDSYSGAFRIRNATK